MSDKLPDFAAPGGYKMNIPTADDRSAAGFAFLHSKVSA
jgi:hypothetical protein